jgi:hypothetical protein
MLFWSRRRRGSQLKPGESLFSSKTWGKLVQRCGDEKTLIARFKVTDKRGKL